MEINEKHTIKGLECCTRGRKSNEGRPCLECPYNECNLVGGTRERQIKGTCQGWLMKDALALFESLEVELKAMRSAANAYKIYIVELTEETARLEKLCALREKDHNDTCDLLFKAEAENERLMREKTALECIVSTARNQAKADTVRKMHERLQAYFGNYVLGYKIPLTEALKAVNQIAKEMIGEGK